MSEHNNPLFDDEYDEYDIYCYYDDFYDVGRCIDCGELSYNCCCDDKYDYYENFDDEKQQ